MEQTAQAGDKLPEYWTQTSDTAGLITLTYAVRGGKAQVLLGALGIFCLLAAAYGTYWMLSGGGVTAAGVVLVLLVPGGLAIFGAHCLDTVFWLRHEYLLGPKGLTARRLSLRASGIPIEISRRAVTAVAQRYTPPRQSDSRTSQGTWTTFLSWRRNDGRTDEYAFVGLGTASEARWLGPILASWAGVSVERSHSAAFEEADPAELPTLDAPH